MRLNGSHILMQILLEHEVDTIFGYPGGAVLHIYDALYDYKDKIRHIMPADEQGAGYAADGYARASGKTGVVIATSGPGATNLVTPLATAYMDSVPVVAITGNVPRALIGKDSFQEVYIAGITMPITKHNFMVQKIEDLAPILREAFRLANSGRKAPVLVDIPKDISAEFCEFEFKEPEKRTLALNAEAKSAIKEALNLIKNAKKPLFYIGGGAKDSSKVLLKLMQSLKIPCVHTSMAAGTISCFEPLNLGLLGMHGSKSANLAVKHSDLLIAVGARFSDRVALNTDKFAQNAKKIQIDIDKSEHNKNVKVECSVIADLNTALKELEKEALSLNLNLNTPDTKAWLDELESLRKEEALSGDFGFFEKENANFSFDKNAPLSAKNLFKLLSFKAGKDAIYTTDVGQHQMWALQFLAHQKPRSFLTSGGLGTMGYGYGAALGAALAMPTKRVFHISGDGSFLMNLNEVTTAVEYELPVISIILNNHTLGMVRQWQTSFYKKRYSSTDLNKHFDYVKVAGGFGAQGFSVRTMSEFEIALDKALSLKIPVWIECLINKDAKVLPMIASGQSVDEIITKDEA